MSCEEPPSPKPATTSSRALMTWYTPRSKTATPPRIKWVSFALPTEPESSTYSKCMLQLGRFMELWQEKCSWVRVRPPTDREAQPSQPHGDHTLRKGRLSRRITLTLKK